MPLDDAVREMRELEEEQSELKDLLSPIGNCFWCVLDVDGLERRFIINANDLEKAAETAKKFCRKLKYLLNKKAEIIEIKRANVIILDEDDL